ncbi:MAG: hypothetical protein ACR2HF_13250 [Methylococcaceae bacterium]
MQTALIILFLVLAIVVGNAMVLLRTAKTPQIPAGVKPRPYDEDED